MIIERAKGVVAQRLGVPMRTAFELLRRHARKHDLRLVEVARQTVENELDPAVLSAPHPASDVRSSAPRDQRHG